MRTKLLGKLTGRFVIQKRNNEYRAFDHLEKAGGVFDCSKWGSYEEAVLIRRKWILAEARLNYKNPKRNDDGLYPTFTIHGDVEKVNLIYIDGDGRGK